MLIKTRIYSFVIFIFFVHGILKINAQNNARNRQQLDICENDACAPNDEGFEDSSRTLLELVGEASFTETTKGQLNIATKMNITHTTKESCPGLENAHLLTRGQLIERLTAPCRYDKLQRPVNASNKDGPAYLYIRLDISLLPDSASKDPQFVTKGVLQMRYADPRLAFGSYIPGNRRNILGQNELRQKLWSPHIYFSNDIRRTPLNVEEEDIITSISPEGEVLITLNIQTTLNCWVHLQKFPFDDQTCATFVENLLYNASELVLLWDQPHALIVNTRTGSNEFILDYVSSEATSTSPNSIDLILNGVSGEISTLSFTVYLSRQSGYYIMAYFLPSMMIVAISWVTFWLQPDQTPARTTLGTTTMLSFITLTSTQEGNLPKVNYVKISDIWFLSCTLFIFGSLVEFAFVNTIWRRKHNVELKRASSTHLLRNTLTPQNNRHGPNIPAKIKKVSTANSEITRASANKLFFIGTEARPDMERQDSTYSSISAGESNDAFNFNIESPAGSVGNTPEAEKSNKNSWASLTPQEVSLWIDRKARFIFPLAFIIFNAFFWAFVLSI